jgi:hypothetical protein
MPETPNRSDVVQSVYDHGHYDLTTVEGCCIFTQNCAFALHNEDPRWGLLKKNPGQHQCASGTAVDNVLYSARRPGAVVAVDIIHASASPDAAPSWSPDTPRYTVADWLAPDALPVPTAALPRPWVCHSGFDLSQWTPSEMDAWLAVFRASGYNAIRIVPASRFRGPDGEGRTLEEGIIALPAALDACRRAGLWAEVSILVDTGEDYYNLDRSQMSFYVQDVWEECLYHLDVVKCIGACERELPRHAEPSPDGHGVPAATPTAHPSRRACVMGFDALGTRRTGDRRGRLHHCPFRPRQFA